MKINRKLATLAVSVAAAASLGMGFGAAAAPAASASTASSAAQCVNGKCCYTGHWGYGWYRVGNLLTSTAPLHYGRYYIFTFSGGFDIATSPPNALGHHC